MLEPRRPRNEQERLATLAAYQVLDTPEEPQFDRLVNVARALFDAPMAALSLTDGDRQWCKARCGAVQQQSSRANSFSAHVVAEGKALTVLDTHSDLRFFDNPLVTSEPFVRFFAGAPLRSSDGHMLGTFCIADTEPRAAFDAEQQLLLQNLADTAIDALEWRRQRNDLFLHAMHDGLTGLPNRPLFENRLQQTLFQAQREGGIVAVFRLGLDNFRSDDNSFNQALGDRLLTGVARRLEHAFRVADTIARWSGDEFAALARLRNTAELPTLIQRLGATLCHDPVAARRVTVSAGAALYPDHGDSPQALIHAAEVALASARATGYSGCNIAGRSSVIGFGPAYRSA